LEASVTWQDEENARQAGRLRRQAEWDEQHRDAGYDEQHRDAGYDSPAGWSALGDLDPPSDVSRPPRPGRCNCGCAGADLAAKASYPDALGIAPESGQPAAVLLAWQLGHRSDPAAIREEARSAAAAELAEPRLDGRNALRQLVMNRNPDGSNLSGSRALALIRQLGVGGVGHEPGVRP
jgi:hypothetical protein